MSQYVNVTAGNQVVVDIPACTREQGTLASHAHYAWCLWLVYLVDDDYPVLLAIVHCSGHVAVCQ